MSSNSDPGGLAHRPRILMGPGPADVPDRVLRAMAAPLLGHLDPGFLEVLDRVGEMLRHVFGTRSARTLAVSGTGTAGMETALANLLEPGDAVVVGVCGYFGARMADIADRLGARVVRVESEWGDIVSEETMAATVLEVRPTVVALVHAETSTGVLQPVASIARAAKEAGALLVLDCVTSLGGCEVDVDGWGVDVAYSASQKCLGAPPGLSPIAAGERAIEKVRRRASRVPSFYFDLEELSRYWGPERAYHHTAPAHLYFALYEALRDVLEEGIAARIARHRRHHEALVAGLSAMGLELASRAGHRLPVLHPVRVPEGVAEADVRRQLAGEHGIEIGAGLGPLRGKVWRVGLMGGSCDANHVLVFLAALERVLRARGVRLPESGAEAAAAWYAAHP